MSVLDIVIAGSLRGLHVVEVVEEDRDHCVVRVFPSSRGRYDRVYYCHMRLDDGHDVGSSVSGVRDSGGADPRLPVAGVSPHRPLLLRSDIPWTPEGRAREPSAGSASSSSGSGLTVSPSYHPLRSRSGGQHAGT